MPRGLVAKALSEEAVEGSILQVFEAGYEGEYYFINVCIL